MSQCYAGFSSGCQLRDVVCYHCGKPGHIARKCGQGLSDLSCGLVPVLGPRVKPREAEQGEPMDCSFWEALQEGGWEHSVVMAWIGNGAV